MIYNTIGKLYDALIENIQKQSVTNKVFGEEIFVIVPNNNVANHLKMKLADKHGVLVRVNFLTKEEFIYLHTSSYRSKCLGFEPKYLRYYILNILDDQRISNNIASYYQDDFMKKYNYAKDLEKSFIHYQNNISSLLDKFENYKLDNDIKTIYELEAFIYQKIRGNGFTTFNKVVEHVDGTGENIHVILDQNESELFNNLIKKFSSTYLYKLVLNNSNEEIELFNNWSKIREMESVWDYITNVLENTNLILSDILVLFPNVDEYVTAINYVFSKKIDSQNKYPYFISNHFNEIEAYQQFLNRLRIEINYRLEANKIFDLFNLSLKLRKVNYSELELSLIKDWIKNNGIRNENLDKEFENDFSWEKGFEQLILGMMMTSDSFNWLDDYAAIDISLNEYHLFEDLYKFVKTIKKLSKSEYDNLQQLNDLILESLIVFFGSSEDENSIVNQITHLWLEIVNQQLVILNKIPPIKIVLKILEEQLKLFANQQINISGITFGNINEYNLVDAKLKIICGLGDNAFPNVKIESNLNLDQNNELNNIKTQERLFRNLTNNDTKIVLSYIGFNEANRKKINRSVFIDLFVKDRIKEIRHKLHPFDDIYLNDNNDDYYTYDQRYNTNKKLENKTPFVNKTSLSEGIYKNLNELKRVISAPVRNWFKNIVKVSFPEDEELLKNSPLYFLKTDNRLEYFQIKGAILRDYSHENDDEIKKLSARGIIPYDSFGNFYINGFKKLYNEISYIFKDKERYVLIENINIIYKDYFLNISQVYHDVFEDIFLILTPTVISQKKKMKMGTTLYDFRTMFRNYLFEALLIKLSYNKKVVLIGFNKENELVEYDKNIVDVFNINATDENEQKRLLEEKLEYLWRLNEVFENDLYLFDLSNVEIASIDEGKDFLNIIKNITNSSSDLNNNKLNDLLNNFNEVEKIFSLVDSAKEEYLNEKMIFNKNEIIQILEIFSSINYILNKFLNDFGSNNFGIKYYDIDFNYLLNNVVSVQTFIDKFGLMPLLKSFLLSYEIGQLCNFSESFP